MSAVLRSVATIHRFPTAEPVFAGPCLAVGLPGPIAQSLAGARPVLHLSLRDLCAREEMSPGPDLVACPLLADWGDAPDVMACLRHLSYRGPLVVVSPHLPDAAMVEGELKRRARGLRFSLLTL